MKNARVGLAGLAEALCIPASGSQCSGDTAARVCYMSSFMNRGITGWLGGGDTYHIREVGCLTPKSFFFSSFISCSASTVKYDFGLDAISELTLSQSLFF
jgi:hypothetical protein